ncbi:MAG: hypothetical protein AcusKO_02470 [Acuticoccus sp.]
MERRAKRLQSKNRVLREARAVSSRSADNGVADPVRRDFLYIATGALGATFVGMAAWPFIDSLNPAADVSALSEVEVDIADIQVGERVTVMWQSKPVFIDHRTAQQIEAARSEDVDSLPDPESDEAVSSGRNGSSSSAYAHILAASPSANAKATRWASGVAGSVRATARTTTPQAACAAARPPPICWSRRTDFSQTLWSSLVDTAASK